MAGCYDKLHPRYEWFLEDSRVSSDRVLRDEEHYRQGYVLYLNDELLTNDPDRTRGLLAELGVDSCQTAEAEEIDLFSVHLHAEADALTVARRLKEMAPELSVGAHQLLAPAQRPKIGPGDQPQPRPSGPRRRYNRRLNAKFGVTVVDTGGFPVKDALAASTTFEARDRDPVDFNTDAEVDWYGAGHGVFIGGVLAAGAPGVAIRQDSFFENLTSRKAPVRPSMFTEAAVIRQVNAALPHARYGRKTLETGLINLSLGTYADDIADLVGLRLAIEHWTRSSDALFVCAAGNDAISDPWFPAAFAGWTRYASRVVSVGALEPTPGRTGQARPAEYSNYGDWVNAWAPGTHDSYYPKGYTFPAGMDGVASDRLFKDGYARWSGTSFAAPFAGGEITREAVLTGATPLQAWGALRGTKPFVVFG
jgi:hypothetical protein